MSCKSRPDDPLVNPPVVRPKALCRLRSLFASDCALASSTDPAVNAMILSPFRFFQIRQ